MINEQSLILYYYDELPDHERAAVEAALAGDAELNRSLHALSADLDALAEAPMVDAPVEAVVNWRFALDSAIHAEQNKPAGRPWAWPLAAAAVLAIGIAIGISLNQQPGLPQAPALVAPTPNLADGEAPRPAFDRGLSEYMQSSQLRLVSLQEADPQQRVALIAEIVAQNRLFERAAEENGAPELARVLRAFETMLIEMVREETSPDQVASVIDQLAFEFSVMLTKLSRQPPNESVSL